MNFARVNNAHFNLDLMLSFYWCGGKLFVYWLGESEPDTYEDRDRTNYERLCNAARVRSVGGDPNGKS